MTTGKRRWINDTQWVYENAIHYKDPDSILDYSIDWTLWLGADNVSSITWTVATGLTQTATSNTTKTGTIWLSGGTAGTDYLVTARLNTTANRRLDTSLLIKVRQS